MPVGYLARTMRRFGARLPGAMLRQMPQRKQFTPYPNFGAVVSVLLTPPCFGRWRAVTLAFGALMLSARSVCRGAGGGRNAGDRASGALSRPMSTRLAVALCAGTRGAMEAQRGAQGAQRRCRGVYRPAVGRNWPADGPEPEGGRADDFVCARNACSALTGLPGAFSGHIAFRYPPPPMPLLFVTPMLEFRRWSVCRPERWGARPLCNRKHR